MSYATSTYVSPTYLPAAEIVDVAEQLGIDFTMAPFSIEELKLGIEVELEHERLSDGCVATPAFADADLAEVGLIAIAHLQEAPQFYTLLTRAHAPGDSPLPQYEHADVGTD